MVKNLIRKSLLEQGQLLSKNFVHKANIDIQNAAIKHLDIKSSKNILSYFPYKNEVSLEIISQEFKKYKNNIFMPRIVSANKLKFNLFKENATLEKNKYGINEVKNEDYLDSVSFDLMFIPFVGVDKGGYRLGYGGGYFDRSLGNISFKEKKPIIVGLGYDFQVLKEDFAESHDLKYDIVITQTRIHSYSWAIKYHLNHAYKIH